MLISTSKPQERLSWFDATYLLPCLERERSDEFFPKQRRAIVPEIKSAPISILIVDSQPIFLLGLSTLIGSMGDGYRLVGKARDGIEAECLARAFHPHVILMGLRLPKESGIESTKSIKEEFPEIQIIMLSSPDDMSDLNAVMLTGASGYLLKSVSEDELEKAIVSVLNGEVVFTPVIAKNLLTVLRQPGKGIALLSEREIQVLRSVAHGGTNKKIALDMFLSVRTIETHIQSIFIKLGVTSRTEAVTTAIRKQLIDVA